MYISRIQMQFCFPIFLLPFNSCLCLASLLLSSFWCLKAPSCSCDALMAARWPTIRALVDCVSSCSFLFPDPLRLPVSILHFFRMGSPLGHPLPESPYLPSIQGTRQRPKCTRHSAKGFAECHCLSSVLVTALGLPNVRYNALGKAQSTLQTGGFW